MAAVDFVLMGNGAVGVDVFWPLNSWKFGEIGTDKYWTHEWTAEQFLWMSGCYTPTPPHMFYKYQIVIR